MPRNTLIWGIGLIVISLFIYAGWQVYDLGKVRGVTELKTLRMEYDKLQRRHDKLSGEHKRLREQVAILERSSEIDRQAAQGVKDEMGQLQDELQAAREEIGFYRGIVAPGDAISGLRIHRFSVEPGLKRGEYHYDLVLTQVKRNDRKVSGVVDWTIAGLLDGDPADLALSEVTDPAVEHLKFRFRYFQNLAGTINLPPGFDAKTVVLQVKPAGKGQPDAVEQVYDWPEPDLS